MPGPSGTATPSGQDVAIYIKAAVDRARIHPKQVRPSEVVVGAKLPGILICVVIEVVIDANVLSR